MPALAGNLEGDEKYIKFLDKGNISRVVSEEEKCWRLESGRTAKKKTEGLKWTWCDVDDSSAEVDGAPTAKTSALAGNHKDEKFVKFLDKGIIIGRVVS